MPTQIWAFPRGEALGFKSLQHSYEKNTITGLLSLMRNLRFRADKQLTSGHTASLYIAGPSFKSRSGRLHWEPVPFTGHSRLSASLCFYPQSSPVTSVGWGWGTTPVYRGQAGPEEWNDWSRWMSPCTVQLGLKDTFWLESLGPVQAGCLGPLDLKEHSEFWGVDIWNSTAGLASRN